jgi:hypothetical protein
MTTWVFAIVLGSAAALAVTARVIGLTGVDERVHVRNRFEFSVGAPPDEVTPLFGAHRERAWSPGWDPRFVYPQPAEDRPGEVFTVTRGGHTSTWINTAFDLEAGHIAYAYVVPDAMAVSIDIRTSADGPARTRVEVIYERTALSAETNDHVRRQGELDAGAGAHWQQAIEECLRGPR